MPIQVHSPHSLELPVEMIRKGGFQSLLGSFCRSFVCGLFLPHQHTRKNIVQLNTLQQQFSKILCSLFRTCEG